MKFDNVIQQGIQKMSVDANVFCIKYIADDKCVFKKNQIIDVFTFAEFAQRAGVSAEKTAELLKDEQYFLQPTGWQSWSPGWELAQNETYPTLIPFVPSLRHYTDADKVKKTKNEIVGHLITYLRWGNTYLVMASVGKSHKLPASIFLINRKKKTITIQVQSRNRSWDIDETMAEIAFFCIDGYFNFKDVLASLYSQPKRQTLDFLNVSEPGHMPKTVGWCSWYSHYTQISEKIIYDVATTLDKAPHVLTELYGKQKKPMILQVDDGWQIYTGTWKADPVTFPYGMSRVVEIIESNGYIPGLWCAPFVIDKRGEGYEAFRRWILRDSLGNEVSAGSNPNWDGSFVCLDLSIPEVQGYMVALAETFIGEWNFRYIKWDFLYAGMLEGKFKNGGSASQWFSLAMDNLTKVTETSKGEPAAFLCCGAPFEIARKYSTLFRIGSDTREKWDGRLKHIHLNSRPSAYVSMKDILGRSYLNGPVMYSDPDVMFLRDGDDITLTQTEKELIALVIFLFGSQIMTSDILTRKAYEQRKFHAYILRLYMIFADEEFGVIHAEGDGYLIETRSGTYSGVINLSNTPFKVSNTIPFAKNFSGLSILNYSETAKQFTSFAPHSISLYQNK